MFNYHFITSILKSPKYRTWSVQTFYWCSTEPVWKFIHLLGGKSKSFGNKSCKICLMILFVFHFSAIWSVTLNKSWNLIGRFVLSVAIREYITSITANQITGTTSDFKMGVIKLETSALETLYGGQFTKTTQLIEPIIPPLPPPHHPRSTTVYHFKL